MNLYLKMLIIFIVTQLLGLWVANIFIQENIKTSILNDNPEDIANALMLIAYILLFTGFFLVVLRVSKVSRMISLLEKFVVFVTANIVFYTFVPELAFMFAIFLLALRVMLPENILLRNVSAVIATAGVGALLGVSLGIYPILLFVALLSLYDVIAVFFTKHMVTMAKAIQDKNLAMSFVIPTKEHNYQLGTGDLVMPLVFAVSAMNSFIVANQNTATVGMLASVLVTIILLASVAGLFLTLWIASRKKIAMPALPLQGLFMIIGWFAFNMFF